MARVCQPAGDPAAERRDDEGRVGHLAGVGVGNIFGNFLSGALRNPSAADGQFTRAIVGVAFAEALGLFAFVIGILLLFR